MLGHPDGGGIVYRFVYTRLRYSGCAPLPPQRSVPAERERGALIRRTTASMRSSIGRGHFRR